MRPYGMKRYDHGDADIAGCRCNGHSTAVYALRGPGGDLRALHSLRGGKKARTRRTAKRVARAEGRRAEHNTDD